VRRVEVGVLIDNSGYCALSVEDCCRDEPLSKARVACDVYDLVLVEEVGVDVDPQKVLPLAPSLMSAGTLDTNTPPPSSAGSP
jgi:hypothetical protein